MVSSALGSARRPRLKPCDIARPTEAELAKAVTLNILLAYTLRVLPCCTAVTSFTRCTQRVQQEASSTPAAENRWSQSNATAKTRHGKGTELY